MVYLAVAVLLAMAIASTWVRTHRGALAGIASLILVDFVAAPISLTPLSPSAIDERLAHLPDGAVLEVPLGIGDGFGGYGDLDYRTIYSQTVHGHPTVGGFVARMSTPLKERYLDTPALATLLRLSSPTDNAPSSADADSAETLQFMRAHNVRFVMLHRRAPAPLRDYVLRLPVRPVASDGDAELYELAWN